MKDVTSCSTLLMVALALHSTTYRCSAALYSPAAMAILGSSGLVFIRMDGMACSWSSNAMVRDRLFTAMSSTVCS